MRQGSVSPQTDTAVRSYATALTIGELRRQGFPFGALDEHALLSGQLARTCAAPKPLRLTTIPPRRSRLRVGARRGGADSARAPKG